MAGDGMIDVFALVGKDLEARNQMGYQRFGGPLTVDGPTSGTEESSLVHAYEEVLDLAVYLRKEIARRGLMPS